MNAALSSLLPAQGSSIAPQVDNLYFFLIGVSVFFTVIAMFLVALFAVKYRRRSDDERPEQPHESSTLEFVCGGGLLVLVMVMFFWGASVFFTLNSPPADAHEVFVVGKQWMWKIQHPEGKREINELHVPVNKPVRLTMTSEDVIHSFYVPAFRMKNDAVPGRYTTLWFNPTVVGTYHLFCAEYCGTEHSRMGGWVYVMSQTNYDAWLGGAAVSTNSESQVAAGARLFSLQGMGCVTCHSPDSKVRGPALTGLPGSTVTLRDGTQVIADDEYLRTSILSSQSALVAGYEPIMPLYKTILSEEQVLQLIAYIKSLSSGGGTEHGS